MRMPVFTWMTFAVSFLLAFSLPIIAIALFYVTFDRKFGTTFFLTEGGGDPILWQHLFWLFGHPEVYIVILPAFGVLSEIISTFSRRPIFGYTSMVYAMATIGIISFVVYGHHMFVSGMNPLLGKSFMILTLVISVPAEMLFLNW